MKDDEKGMIVVEAVLSFTVFIMVCLAVAYLTNIFTVHNKIQFAINSTAKQIASYTYLAEAFGVRSAKDTWQSDGEKYVDNIDNAAAEVIKSLKKMQELSDDVSDDGITLDTNSISAIINDVEETVSSGKSAASSLKTLFKDPNSLLAGIIYMMGDGAMYTAGSAIGTAAAEALASNYLGDNYDEYLKKTYNVDELDFSGSTLLCDDDSRIVDIVVEYDIELNSLKFLLGDNAKIHVVQRASVAAWVGGDDQKVSDYLDSGD